MPVSKKTVDLAALYNRRESGQKKNRNNSRFGFVLNALKLMGVSAVAGFALVSALQGSAYQAHGYKAASAAAATIPGAPPKTVVPVPSFVSPPASPSSSPSLGDRRATTVHPDTTPASHGSARRLSHASRRGSYLDARTTASYAVDALQEQALRQQQIDQYLAAHKLDKRVAAQVVGSKIVLLGRVFDDEQKSRLEIHARRIPGISAVVNMVSTDTSYWEQQAETAQKALDAADLKGVRVKIVGDQAFLSGKASSELEKLRAATIVEQSVPSVRNCENIVRVERSSFLGL